ncbi:MAG: peptidoglycan-associated lipoprotein Pal [Burkholderiaceae bacterium]|jgi:peptidoglycan-associated lipoprotein
MNKTLRYTAAIAAIALLSACASNKTATDNNAVKTVDVTNGIGADGVPAPQARSVYFDLDRYTVRTDGQPVVRAHSEFLNKNRNQHVLLQGNTDERGTAEYNLALGQRRSEAVKNAMSALGVNTSQIEAVSLGKEKPKAQGSNEAAWAENRRVDFVY